MELPPPPPAGSPPGGRLPPPGADTGFVTSTYDHRNGPYGGPPAEPGGPPIEPSGALVGRLNGAWRWTLGLGWCIVLAGLGALAQAAFLVDADPWWLSFKPLPFALPVAVLLALVSDARWALPLSLGGALVLGVLAAVDAIDGNPAVALGGAVCAASALLLTVAAILGRVRRTRPSVPGSAT